MRCPDNRFFYSAFASSCTVLTAVAFFSTGIVEARTAASGFCAFAENDIKEQVLIVRIKRKIFMLKF